MKKYVFIFFLSIYCFSCKQEINNEFDKVILYYYGRSPIGTTFEVPVQFYNSGKEIASFTLYSYNADLENGIYKYNDTTYAGINWVRNSYYVDKTFYKGLCKWGDKIITDGSVTVTKENNTYTFIVDVIDNTGKKHTGKFKGNVTKENKYPQSEIKGKFAEVYVADTGWQGAHKLMIGLEGGDTFYSLKIYYSVPCEEMPNDIVGVYQINNGIQSSKYWCDILNRNMINLADGQITVSRDNNKYKIDVDVTDVNGYRIQECFDGGYFGSSIY
ncbi:MAG: hypothetical protein LBN95_08980 [Prevotellaceae bacterium]|jgi:hypothetical protein|nr:hypothetical protein [Prevotellaceae bacterium]